MNNSLVETKKLMNLIRFPDESGKSISLEQTNSLPIPVLENGDLYAYAFYYGSKTHVPSAKVDIYPPTFIGKFDWSRCRVVWIHPTEPDHLGMGPSRFKIIGSIDYRALDDRARASGLGGAVERSRAMEDLY